MKRETNYYMPYSYMLDPCHGEASRSRGNKDQSGLSHYIAENLSPPPAGGYQSTYYRPISGYMLTLVEAPVGGHSGTEGGRTFVTYFAKEGVFL